MNGDEQWMRLAIEQAQQADYQTWQNPRVGAVVVKAQTVLAVGHTQQFGGPMLNETQLVSSRPNS